MHHIVECSNNQFDFVSYNKERRELVENKLAEYFAQRDGNTLWQSMSYSVLSEGKKLRALLCIASSEAIVGLGNNLQSVLPLCCAIEMIHAMSLIHDDLPAL